MRQYIQILILLISLGCFSQETANNSNDFNTEVITTLNDTVKNKKGGILQEVIITVNQIKTPASVVRSGIKTMDLPQSLQIIDSEIIEQQQSIRLSDIVKNANGVYVGSARGGAQESLWSRGNDMTANNMFKNGFRINAGSMPEVASLERVEILKGSAALLFGNVAPGGILNMVTKVPLFKKGGEIAMQIGSYSFYKPSADIYGSLNKKMAYRFVGTYENSESFRDVVKKERYYINPSFLFKASDKTEIIVQGDYLHDNWTPDFGTGVIEKEIANIPRNTYLGAIWSNGQTKQLTASGLVKHDFNNNWKLNFNFSYQTYNRTSKGTERIQPSSTTSTTVYGDWKRPLGQNKNLERIIAEQISLQGNFETGKIKHQLFNGIDLENSFREDYKFKFDPITYGSGNIFDFDNFDQGTGIPEAIITQIVKTDTNRFGIYAQDLISLTPKIKVLAGLRWSWQEAQVDTHDWTVNPVTVTEGEKRIDKAFSPKLGLIYQHTKDLTVFASYANSFTPNSGTTTNAEALKPSIIDQYEIGVKQNFWKGLLSTNVTVYQIINSDLYQTSPLKADGVTPNSDSTLKIWGGATKSKGVEIDITAKPTEGLNINAGYSYNDMRYTKTSGLNGSFIEGDRLARTPSNTANLSFFYTSPSGKLKGISFGAIGNYIGNRLGGWNNQIVSSGTPPVTSVRDREIPLEGYTTIDFSAGYQWKQFSLLCKLSNVANVLNYTVHENYSVNPIAPRQVLTSIKYKF